MNLESIIQSEVGQKEKNKYHILTHIYVESRKMVLMNLFAGQQWRCRHREQTCGNSGGRRGWDKWTEWYGNICITVCKIDSKGNLHATQGAQPSALRHPREVGWGGSQE